jgi:hypothetical protein
MKFIVFRTKDRNTRIAPCIGAVLKEIHRFSWEEEDEGFAVWEVEFPTLKVFTAFVQMYKRIVVHNDISCFFELPEDYSDQQVIEIYDGYRE